MPPTRRRLLLVVHSARLGGAQRVALDQAEALARDHELTVAVGHGPLREGFAELGDLVRAPTRLPIWGASRRRWALEITRALPDALRLAWLARRRRIDAIITNSTVLVAPVLAARIARVPVVVHAQEAPKSVTARRLFRFHGALADTVVAISPWIAEALGNTEAHVLLNPVGIRVPAWVPRPSRDPAAPLHLLVVGSIDPHKRQAVAIHALAKLRSTGVDALIEFVGAESDPAYGAQLRQLTGCLGLVDRVRFVGPSLDVPGLLRQADVLLLPAGEVTPLVLMEAMAYGTPVVAAQMGSIGDVVGDSGLLVPAGDAEAMAGAIRRLAVEPGLAEDLVENGRRRVETEFDARRSQARLNAEIERLLPSPRTSTLAAA